MQAEALFEALFQSYRSRCPDLDPVQALLRDRNETVRNDHIALRTYGDDRIGLERLAAPFEALGYVAAAQYTFPEKKLRARYWRPPERELPRVFISELQLSAFSASFQSIVRSLLEALPNTWAAPTDILLSPRWWTPRYTDYQALLAESEYGAWLAAFGLCANHFTLDVGALTTFEGLEELCAWLREQGCILNRVGGAIKGSPAQYLEQASTRAREVPVSFVEGTYAVPGCYYEMARRYPMPDGQLFDGFLPTSADKIFHSTDVL